MGKKTTCPGITIEGVGNDATIDGWGIRIKSASSVEISNIGIINCDSSEGDNIGLQQDNSYIWVHNATSSTGMPAATETKPKETALSIVKNPITSHFPTTIFGTTANAIS